MPGQSLELGEMVPRRVGSRRVDFRPLLACRRLGSPRVDLPAPGELKMGPRRPRPILLRAATGVFVRGGTKKGRCRVLIRGTPPIKSQVENMCTEEKMRLLSRICG